MGVVADLVQVELRLARSMPTSLPISRLSANVAYLTSGEDVPMPHAEPPPPKTRMPVEDATPVPV